MASPSNTNTTSPLGDERVVVAGAGSLGSVYGGFLARAGLDVQLLAREPHARAVAEQGGLVLETEAETALVPLRAEWRPERIEPAEILVVLAQTPDTEAVLSGLGHVREGLRLAVSLQNGVEKDEILARWCGPAAIGAVAMVGGTLLEPGRVRHTFRGRTIIGELPSGTSPRVERLAELLERGGLSTVVSSDVRSVEWTKLVHAAPTMAVTALSRLPFHAALQSPQLAPVFATLAREGAAVAHAAGARLDDETMRFPIGTIAAAPHDEAAAMVQEQGRLMEEAGMTDVRVSMLHSIERGRRTEVEAIHGYVVREADRLGVDVPAMRLCYRLLAAIDETLA